MAMLNTTHTHSQCNASGYTVRAMALTCISLLGWCECILWDNLIKKKKKTKKKAMRLWTVCAVDAHTIRSESIHSAFDFIALNRWWKHDSEASREKKRIILPTLWCHTNCNSFISYIRNLCNKQFFIHFLNTTSILWLRACSYPCVRDIFDGMNECHCYTSSNTKYVLWTLAWSSNIIAFHFLFVLLASKYR